MSRRTLTESQFNEFKKKLATMSRLSFMVITQADKPEIKLLEKSQTYDQYLYNKQPWYKRRRQPRP